MTLKVGGLFAGYGGLELAISSVLDAEPAWFSEIEPAPSKVLAHHWPDIPNLGDITKVDWSIVEPVDVLTGGFPCQDVSHAGKRLGLRPTTRTGLWSHMAYAIEELRPALVVAENVRGLLSAEAHGDLEPCPWCVGDGPAGALRALGAVLGDLADLRYDAWWYGLRAADVGAAHGRFRVFVFAAPADADLTGLERRWPGRSGPGERASWPGGVAAGLTLLPTPLSSDAGPRGGTTGYGLRDWSRSFTATALLPTPRATDGTKGGPNQRGSSGDLMLPSAVQDWREYEAAIRRQEAGFGCPAPSPTEPGKNGQPRLSPRFVEWLMGLPAGWVTDIPDTTRNDQLKMLGNGVVPQQATAALRAFLADSQEAVA